MPLHFVDNAIIGQIWDMNGKCGEWDILSGELYRNPRFRGGQTELLFRYRSDDFFVYPDKEEGCYRKGHELRYGEAPPYQIKSAYK